MSEIFNYCQIVGRTDVGRKRPANEDSMSQAVTQNGLVAVVCDGMGGHVGGAIASKIAVTTIIEHLSEIFYDDPRIAIGEAIEKANLAILRRTQEQPELKGMGSTCVLLLVRGGKVYIGHVGDSRIYLIRSRRIRQLTKDHSYVQMLVDCGEISKDQMEKHPRKNEITNALGLENMKPATVCVDAILPEAGDCFLLCSDGLSGMVPDETIAKVVGKQTEMNAQDRVDKLIELANLNGGVDNITAELVEFSITPGTESDLHEKRRNLTIILSVIAVVVLLISGACWWYFQFPKGNDAENDNITQEVKETIPETIQKQEQGPIQMEPYNLCTIKYQKNAKIVKFIFQMNQFILEYNGKTMIERVEADPQTLVFDKTIIKSEYNFVSTNDEPNLTLYFTDKVPSGIIKFSIMRKDSACVYNYTINVKGGKKTEKAPIVEESKSNSPIDDNELCRKPIDNNVYPNNVDKDDINTDDVETIPVYLTFDGKCKPSKIILSYAKDAEVELISVSEKDKKISTNSDLHIKIHELFVKDIVVEDKLYWQMKKDDKKKQLIFFNNQNVAFKDYYSFSVPCIIQDSKTTKRKVVILININQTNGKEGFKSLVPMGKESGVNK